MSYNYDECVKSIQEHRRRGYAAAAADAPATAAGGGAAPDLEALQQSMDGFADLSKHCPMTPLLWMQYAHDTEVMMEGLMMLESGGEKRLQMMQAKKSALESSTGILELALGEFPGCALLHLYYLESLADYVYQIEGLHKLNSQDGAVGMEVDDRGAAQNKLSSAFDNAWKSVGRGTHINEGLLVSEIYRLHGSFLLYGLSAVGANGGSWTNAVLQQLSTLFEKWSKTPMGEGSNEDLMQDVEYFWEEACSILLSLCGEQAKLNQKQNLDQQKLTLWASIDEERKKTSAIMNALSPYENDIDVAMSNEGIALPRMSLFPRQQDESNVRDDLGLLQPLKRNSEKWKHILLGDSNRFLLGLGGAETSRAFLRATSSLQRMYQDMTKKKSKGDNAERSPLEDYVATYKHSVINSLYERALSECPTVESVWVSYMNFLRGEWTRLQSKMKGQQHMLHGDEMYFQQQQKEELLSALQSTSQRAIRNCPYSVTLFEIRMTTLGLISASNLEPDDITAVINEATDLGFLNNNPQAMLHLRLVAILVVKRRLMSLVSSGTTTTANGIGKDYDDGEEMGISSATHKKTANGKVVYQLLNSTVMEEVQDLLEDIRDMYDEADTYLFKSHPTWAEGKVSFWKHRSLTEAYVLCPVGLALRKASGDYRSTEENGEVGDKEAIQCFEKMVKAQKPSHPDSWREYIRYVSASHLYLTGSATSQPNDIAAPASTSRKTRGLYLRALSTVKKAGQETAVPVETKQSWMGKGIESTLLQRDYDTALSDLCREYLDFERAVGSEESFSQAQTQVRSKLANWHPPVSAIVAVPVQDNQEGLHGKRKIDTDNGNDMPANGSDMMVESNGQGAEEEARSKRAKVKTDLKQPKKTDGVHRVLIGKMEYPAHPFTIHVSKLSKDTQDMDLVDAFRPEFGGIVHAKILREKRTGKGGHHYHGDSKCAGLIQFEERLSVEHALQKDGEFEVGGKKVKIQRSHLPAVGVVPAGMHRVNPKGEGKASKRNKFKKETKMKSMDVEDDGKASDAQVKTGSDQQNKKAVAPSPSSLSFNVLSFKPRGMRQKPKISLDPKKK